MRKHRYSFGKVLVHGVVIYKNTQELRKIGRNPGLMGICVRLYGGKVRGKRGYVGMGIYEEL